MSRTYARIWRTVWLPPATVVCLVGLVTADLAPILMLAALLGGLAALSVVPLDQGRTAGKDQRRVAVRRASVVATAIVAVGGWHALLGGVVWPLVVLASATSPAVVGLAAAHRRTRRAAAMPDLRSPARLDSLVGCLDDHQLCRAWQRSFFLLRGATSVRQYCRVVVLRQAYIDEMERRNAEGLHRWLGSAPRPSSNPEPFLTGGSEAGHNWDESA